GYIVLAFIFAFTRKNVSPIPIPAPDNQIIKELGKAILTLSNEIIKMHAVLRRNGRHFSQLIHPVGKAME
ncbi:19105_t:CDS:2, partial [Dentiscutata erythropus]